MKDQYFGDFGDYQKFSLLTLLRDNGGFKIIVHWMKTKDDGGKDGGRVAYLSDPKKWQSYDKKIFEFLKEHINLKNRNVSIFEKSVCATGIRFINNNIENSSERSRLLKKIKRDKAFDLVFFDPDNGIEVNSTNSNNKHKYVLWKDIEMVYTSGKSVLVYQHYSRKKRDTFIQEKVENFKKYFSSAIFVIKVRHSVYFLLSQNKDVIRFDEVLRNYSNIWKPLVSIIKL